ncbi:hypothetical protein V8C35DRAFT_95035 [Trichoderma chlorosporum]
MDAQNAAESDTPKHAGASPQQQNKHERPRRGSGSDSDPKPRSSLRAPSPSREPKLKTRESSSLSSSTAARIDDLPGADGDSDAETIVLPGKDGHSPSKVRKVRQEDRSESDADSARGNGQPASSNQGDKNATGSRPVEGVKKRLPGPVDKDRQPRSKDGASSGLSSAPTSPPHNHSQLRQQLPLPSHRRRRSDAVAAASPSDSEGTHAKPVSSSLRDKLKSGERLLPHKRKAPKAESDDEADQRKARRQRTTSVTLDTGRTSKEPKPTSKQPQHDPRIRTRSISPHPRQHRRSVSTQLPAHHLSSSLKKKRLPPPLHSADYLSDESSASGSPHPRSSKLRGLATPTVPEPHASPVKMAPHKKHLDAHGQTLLARACARGEYESAKRRLSDRPEDLNVADYAGNTPLQIAAINGCEDIVKLLIDAGCNLDCVNYDKDTPLLDAVDNGHVGVVKLLLDAGVNPRKANVNGEEPIDRVTEDTENGDEIRALLQAAKKRQGERRRTSEDRHSHDYHDARDSHAPDSPRRSPAATMSTSRRSGTVRSTKTRNDLLYMPLDDKTLRQAAGRGDEETVARILQVKEGFDDPESMVAAARGGHDLVIQLLLGLGGASADPPPVKTLQAEFATPMLAAIGQENIKVVELLLEQQNFDPTRKFKGETYYEIARRRQGSNWKEEEHMLKNAYDDYRRTHKDSARAKSPGRRDREREREEKRAKREDAKDDSRPLKRSAASPSREPKKPSAPKTDAPREKRRSDSFTGHGGDDNSQKRGPGRPRKEDNKASNTSDREASPAPTHKVPKPKRTESDATGVSSEGEAVKPRRKLISKGELRDERERQKRGSLASTGSSGAKEPSSPSEPRHEESVDKPKLSEKYHDRTKALKRDESRDRLSVSGDNASKRHRNSLTPDRPSDIDKDDGPVKRRRLESDNQEKRSLPKRPVSEEAKPRKGSISRDNSSKSSALLPRKHREDDPKSNHDERDSKRKDSGRNASGDKSIRVKQEDDDVEMPDADHVKEQPAPRDKRTRETEDEQAKKKEAAEKEDAIKEEERRRAKHEERKKREAEEARQREEETKKRKEQEERDRKKREEDEARNKHREKAERERREAEEATARRREDESRRVEEEKKKQEQEEKKRREEERKRKEEEKRREEEKKLREEEQKLREEEERLRKEQERKVAEEARQLREQEERRERERQERAQREEVERKRVAREAEQRRLREEEERREEQERLREEEERVRLEKLPPLMQWLCTASNPKTTAVAEKFKYMRAPRFDTIRPEMNNTAEGREQWVLNTHVALLLGEKDLSLSKYASWRRVPTSRIAKISLWRTEWLRYTLFAEKLWELGEQLPGCYGGEAPRSLSYDNRDRLKADAWEKFEAMDMFFVKVSDFLDIVPGIPHLQGIKLGVEYFELAQDEHQWLPSTKWKQDPDVARYHGFAPRHKFYVNGVFVGEDLPTLSQTSRVPFPETRVPRRGLTRAYPEDTDYNALCLSQGLGHLIKDTTSPSPLPNGIHSSPVSPTSAPRAKPTINGTNGHAAPDGVKDEAATDSGITNGINGSAS